MTRSIPSVLLLATGSLFSLFTGAPAAPHPVIQNLLDPGTRMEAFFEAAQAHEGLVDDRATGSLRVFSQFCRDLNVTVCPQGEDSVANLYLVTYRPDHEATRPSTIQQSERDYPRAHDDRLFPQSPSAPPGDESNEISPAYQPLPPSLEPRMEKSFAVLDDAGKVVDQSFIQSDTIDNDVIFDLNDDGILEWAESARYEVGGSDNKKRPQLLIVRTIQRPSEILFAVIYNWHAPDQALDNEWSFLFTHAEDSPRAELHLGPLVSGAVQPQITYRWDDASRTYQGPSGGRGEHFKVLDSTTRLKDQISALWRLGGLKYRLHDAPPASPPEKETPPGGTPDSALTVHGPSAHPGVYDPEKHTHPYRAVSLKDLTHEQILKFMCGGKTISDLQRELRQDTRLPPDFWSLPAKEAALSYAEANRNDHHRQLYQLALDDLDEVQPPGDGAIHFSEGGHGTAAQQFLRFDPGPGPSFLISSQDNPVLERVGHLYTPSGAASSLSVKELDDTLAQHLFEIVWWLDRIRSMAPSTSAHSSPDHPQTAATPAFKDQGPANEISTLIFTDLVDNKMRASRSGYAPVATGLADIWEGDFNHDVFLTLTRHLLSNEIPQYLDLDDERAAPGESTSPEEMRSQSLARLTRILEQWSTGASGLPDEIAGDVIAAAAHQGLVELLPSLQKIQRERALTQLEFDQKPASIFEEKSLIEKLTIAIAQLESTGDVERLESLARLNAPASGWAALQLREQHPARYQAVLQHWLTITDGRDRDQVQETLSRLVAPSSEPSIAETPGLNATQLAMTTLENGAAPEADSPELSAAVTELAAQLTNEPAWSDRPSRLHALQLLVPADDPHRHQDSAIDDSLTTLVRSSPDAALRKAAGLALAWRIEQEAWDILWRPFASPPPSLDTSRPGKREDSLNALSYIAAKHGDPYRDALLTLVRDSLASRGDLKLRWLFPIIFELDLRELLSNLESLATSSPADYEGDPDAAWLKQGGVPHRYHLPRKILALWNEKDAPTRTKLFLALGICQGPDQSANTPIAMNGRLEQELDELAHALSFQEKLAVIDFINWIEENGGETLAESNRSLGPRQLAFLARNRNRLLP